MRIRSRNSYNVALIVALLVVGCAEEQPTAVRPPVPPSRPAIEGNVKSVLSADIQFVLELKRKEMIASEGRAWPIYSVHVIDRNHMRLHYLLGNSEVWAYAKRVKGKWKLSNTERVMVTGSNIPTP